jgi:hypothetical protein
LAGDDSGRFRGPGALCKRACEATADRQTRPDGGTLGSYGISIL